ncbi:DUF4221 family protein [Algoriphagus sp. H41]|uniref:DUF4221 family protein n=1 Tax=Algoriphagus oliviformis TaxID=2811231 RepID=A0ABS3C1G1_9BACT|nr:DUF4221 family protein [Algoriphagus oliviformis]MBN7810419.1 DUF4221 family protein [Algoriphagus oliviformis]
MRTQITTILLVISIMGCDVQKQEKKLHAIVHQSVKIPLELTVNPKRSSFQHIDSDSGEYIALHNKIGPRIEIFGLDSFDHIRSIDLATDGPNRIGTPNGFRILSRDSLLIASIPPQVITIGFDGVKKGSIPVVDTVNHVNYLSSNNELPFLFDGKMLFGAQPFFRDFLQTRPDEIGSYSHVYRVDLNSGKTDWLPISHPSDLWDEGKITPHFAWTDRRDTIVVSPQTDHRLWLISKQKGELLGYKEAKSTYVNKFQIINGPPEGDKGITEGLASDRYELLLHDPYRDVFYRFFFIGFDWKDYDLGYRELFANRPKVGVLVLDQNLDKLGEHIFKDHQIEPWNYFVGRKGLYVSTNNPNRKDFDENYLRYDIIRFEGLDYED